MKGVSPRGMIRRRSPPVKAGDCWRNHREPPSFSWTGLDRRRPASFSIAKGITPPKLPLGSFGNFQKVPPYGCSPENPYTRSRKSIHPSIRERLRRSFGPKGSHPAEHLHRKPAKGLENLPERQHGHLPPNGL